MHIYLFETLNACKYYGSKKHCFTQVENLKFNAVATWNEYFIGIPKSLLKAFPGTH